MGPADSMAALANPFDPSQGFADEDYVKPYDPWEDDDDETATPDPSFFDIDALRAKAGRR